MLSYRKAGDIKIYLRAQTKLAVIHNLGGRHAVVRGSCTVEAVEAAWLLRATSPAYGLLGRKGWGVAGAQGTAGDHRVPGEEGAHQLSQGRSPGYPINQGIPGYNAQLGAFCCNLELRKYQKFESSHLVTRVSFVLSCPTS